MKTLLRSVMTAIVSSFALTAAQAANFTLPAIEKEVSVDYPNVKQMSIDEFVKIIAHGEAVELLDVRTEGEYAVSHLAGAKRVEPLSGFEQSTYRPAKSDCVNKYIVLYCSVGVRSSQMAQHFQAEFQRAGAMAVYNLRGGIFAWHNERRPLVNSHGRTDYVHPYDEKYKNLILRQQLVSYAAK